jgi:hypothetical protein
VTTDEFEVYLTGLGLTVEPMTGADGQGYTVIRSITISTGALTGQTCDVAIQRSASVPYIPPAAIHTRPVLVPLGTLSTQASGIGPGWQYWSRRFDHQVTARNLWTHVLTVLGEVA